MTAHEVTSLPAVGILLLAAHTPCPARIIYVGDNAAGPADGASWATACPYLQDALAATQAEKPVEIRVAQGTCRPNRSWAEPEGVWDINKMEPFEPADGMSVSGGHAG